MIDLRIYLTSMDERLAEAWRVFCGDLEFVHIHEGSILELKCDAIVSPANSFGFMDGGIDALYTSHFGRELQARLRRTILEEYHGELLVGQAAIVETNDASIPYMIAAPTMRVPMNLGESVNPYLAARAVFLLLRHGRFGGEGAAISDRIKSVAFPGLGTGVGKVGPGTCARQVRQAINDVLLEEYTMPRSWAEASERHQLLYTSKPTRLQY